MNSLENVLSLGQVRAGGRDGKVLLGENAPRRKVAEETIIGYRVFIQAPEGPFRLRGCSL